MHSLAPHAVHSHAYLGSPNHLVCSWDVNPAAEAVALPHAQEASGLVSRKAPRLPHPTRHAYNPVVFLCKQQPPPPHTRSKLCSSLLVPTHAGGLLHFYLTLGVPSSSLLGRLSHTPQLLAFHSLACFYPVIFIPTYMGNHRRTAKAPYAPRPLRSFHSAQTANAYLLYV